MTIAYSRFVLDGPRRRGRKHGDLTFGEALRDQRLAARRAELEAAALLLALDPDRRSLLLALLELEAEAGG